MSMNDYESIDSGLQIDFSPYVGGFANIDSMNNVDLIYTYIVFIPA